MQIQFTRSPNRGLGNSLKARKSGPKTYAGFHGFHALTPCSCTVRAQKKSRRLLSGPIPALAIASRLPSVPAHGNRRPFAAPRVHRHRSELHSVRTSNRWPSLRRFAKKPRSDGPIAYLWHWPIVSGPKTSVKVNSRTDSQKRRQVRKGGGSSSFWAADGLGL